MPYHKEVEAYLNCRAAFEKLEQEYKAKQVEHHYRRLRAQEHCNHEYCTGGSAWMYSTKQEGNRQVPCQRCYLCDLTREVPDSD
jgi:hypothetical protein